MEHNSKLLLQWADKMIKVVESRPWFMKLIPPKFNWFERLFCKNIINELLRLRQQDSRRVKFKMRPMKNTTLDNGEAGREEGPLE